GPAPRAEYRDRHSPNSRRIQRPAWPAGPVRRGELRGRRAVPPPEPTVGGDRARRHALPATSACSAPGTSTPPFGHRPSLTQRFTVPDCKSRRPVRADVPHDAIRGVLAVPTAGDNPWNTSGNSQTRAIASSLI